MSKAQLLLSGIIPFAMILAAPGFAQESFKAEVISVTDGDTVKVLHDGGPQTIRLNAIDCPEKRQAFGSKAKEFTASLCFKQTVTVVPHGHDRYQRTIADITLPDGRSLNAELVKAGLAWWYRKYAPDNKNLADLEQEARRKRVGLWQDPDPVAPWDFRHSKKAPAKLDGFSPQR